MIPSYDDRAVQVLEEAEQLKLQCQHEESIALLEGLLSRDPSNIAALEELADNELSLQHLDRAEKAAKQAVALDTESYMGHYILGFIACAREEWISAEEHLREANKQQASNPEILRCLGWTLFRSGKRVQGIVTLERALNLEPEHPLTLCDLGVCYMEAENIAKAHALFAQALRIEPGNERARACLTMLERFEQVQKV
jgi:Tfp pilus assembly protein PilF